MQKAALVETHNSQRQWQPIRIPIKKPFHQSPIKNPSCPPTVSESFISSGTQEGAATALQEGHDIVTTETCIPTSFSECKHLRKSSCASHALLQLGPCQIQLWFIPVALAHPVSGHQDLPM
jgi:hypothetical protein